MPDSILEFLRQYLLLTDTCLEHNIKLRLGLYRLARRNFDSVLKAASQAPNGGALAKALKAATGSQLGVKAKTLGHVSGPNLSFNHPRSHHANLTTEHSSHRHFERPQHRRIRSDFAFRP